MRDWRGNTVVYTANVGDYEHLGASQHIAGVDYMYFTDGKALPVGDRWQIRHLPDLSHLHPRRAAKLPKVYPHYFADLRKYKYAIWIDGDMQITNRMFVPEILGHLKNGMVISPHFDGRHDAYGEATIRPPKYANEPLDPQVAYYKATGFPEEYGLYECGVMARDLTNHQVEDLGLQWMVENMVWSYQDQVSLPFVLWKTGFQPDVLPQSFRLMNWVHLNAHKRED